MYYVHSGLEGYYVASKFSKCTVALHDQNTMLIILAEGYLVYDNKMIRHTSTCWHTEIMGSTNCQVTAGHPLTQQCAKASQSESDFERTKPIRTELKASLPLCIMVFHAHRHTEA